MQSHLCCCCFCEGVGYNGVGTYRLMGIRQRHKETVRLETTCIIPPYPSHPYVQPHPRTTPSPQTSQHYIRNHTHTNIPAIPTAYPRCISLSTRPMTTSCLACFICSSCITSLILCMPVARDTGRSCISKNGVCKSCALLMCIYVCI